jgi:hypothetical protein
MMKNIFILDIPFGFLLFYILAAFQSYSGILLPVLDWNIFELFKTFKENLSLIYAYILTTFIVMTSCFVCVGLRVLTSSDTNLLDVAIISATPATTYLIYYFSDSIYDWMHESNTEESSVLNIPQIGFFEVCINVLKFFSYITTILFGGGYLGWVALKFFIQSY